MAAPARIAGTRQRFTDQIDKGIMISNMKRLTQQQSGFITLIVMLILILVALIGFAYWRVAHAGK